MTSCETLLNHIGMQQAGSITTDVDGRIRLKANSECTWRKGIYAWVELDRAGSPISVLYVGKAGNSLAARCRQHTSGLADKKPKVNSRNATALSAAFKRENTVAIYGRESAICRIFDRDVSVNDAEEDAANDVLKPNINPRKNVETAEDAFVDGLLDISETGVLMTYPE